MSKIVAIFAHPDDESFGPGGTLLTLSKKHDVYVICVTSGEKAGNSAVREHELLKSAKILGIKEVFFLRYGDGDLCNNLYHKVAESIQKKLDDLQPEKIITFEMRGVSGHIDHVAISMVSSFLFDKLSYIQEIWYFCLSKEHSDLMKNYFIYFPPGYKASEVDEIVDVSPVWEERMRAIHCHLSQKEDMKLTINNLQRLPQEEYFFVRKK